MCQSKIRLLIFDFDGTLFRSDEFNCESINQALKVLGLPGRVQLKDVFDHLGETSAEFYGHILPADITDKWEIVREQHRRQYPDYLPRFAQAFPGVSATLGALKSSGYSLALYSNCSPDYLNAAATTLNLLHFFDYVECCGEHGLTKPDLIRKILSHFEDPPTAVIGDKAHDIEAARANNCLSVGALYGYGKDEPNAADLVIHRITDLLEIFPGHR